MPNRANLVYPVLCHSEWTRIHSQEEDILSNLAVFYNEIFMGFFGILKWVINERYRRRKSERRQFLTQVSFKLQQFLADVTLRVCFPPFTCDRCSGIKSMFTTVITDRHVWFVCVQVQIRRRECYFFEHVVKSN